MRKNPIKIYVLECQTEDGNYETNGFFFKLSDAEKHKKEVDCYKHNVQYGITQNITEKLVY